MKGKYSTTRKWDTTIKEKRFESTLRDSGYTVDGVKEWKNGITDYLLSKGNIQFEFRYYRDTTMTSTQTLKLINDTYKLHKAVAEIGM